MNSKPLWHCEKKLWPTCKHPQENHMTSLKTMQDVFWQLPLRGWVLGHVWAKKETADEWSARLSPLQEPNQDNMLLWLCYIFGINPLFSACWYITLWLCFCFGIYSPVEHCKAWSRCQHQLQSPKSTGSHILWMLYMKPGWCSSEQLGEDMHGFMKTHKTKQRNAAGH